MHDDALFAVCSIGTCAAAIYSWCQHVTRLERPSPMETLLGIGVLYGGIATELWIRFSS